MKHYIQLIGFDGTSFWRLFYIEIYDAKEIYYGIIRKNQSLSFSRHGSGVTNIKINDKKIRMDEIVPNFKNKPISDMTDVEPLGTFVVPNKNEKISEEEYKKFISKKSNAIFLLDLRNFEGTINVQPYLINPIKKEILIRPQCQLYVYTASSPWVAFYVLDVKPKVNEKSKNNFCERCNREINHKGRCLPCNYLYKHKKYYWGLKESNEYDLKHKMDIDLVSRLIKTKRRRT